MSKVPPTVDQQSDVDQIYRRLSAQDAGRPGEWVRRKVQAYAAQQAAERAVRSNIKGPETVSVAAAAAAPRPAPVSASAPAAESLAPPAGKSWVIPATVGAVAVVAAVGWFVVPTMLGAGSTPKSQPVVSVVQPDPLPPVAQEPAPAESAATQATEPEPADVSSAQTPVTTSAQASPPAAAPPVAQSAPAASPAQRSPVPAPTPTSAVATTRAPAAAASSSSHSTTPAASQSAVAQTSGSSRNSTPAAAGSAAAQPAASHASGGAAAPAVASRTPVAAPAPAQAALPKAHVAHQNPTPSEQPAPAAPAARPIQVAEAAPAPKPAPAPVETPVAATSPAPTPAPAAQPVPAPAAPASSGAADGLWTAAKIGDMSSLQSALNSNADVNAIGPEGETPLILAIQHDRVEAVRTLLAHGANPNTPDARGLTPIRAARVRNNYNVLQALQKAGR